MRTFVERVRGNLLIRRSVVYALGTTVFNFGNYLYQVLMGRYLGPSEYGTLAVLFSLLYIVTVPANTVLTVAVRYISTLRARNHWHKMSVWWRGFTKRLLVAGALLFLVSALISPALASFFNINRVSPLILTGGVFMIIFVLTLNRGVLQGLQSFNALSFSFSLEAVLKVVLAVGLVVIGFGVDGAVIAVLLAMGISYVFSFWPLKGVVSSGATDEAVDWTEVIRLAIPVFLAFLFLTLMYNIDMLLVKHFFEPEEAGLYAGLSLMGKVIFFATWAVAGVMLPMVSEAKEVGKRHHNLFWQTFGIVFLGSAVLVLWYFLFPEPTLGILLGASFKPAAPYLGVFGLAMMLLALNNVFLFYFLALHRNSFLVPLALVAVLEAPLIWVYHSSIIQIIQILLVLNLLLIVAFFVTFALLKRRGEQAVGEEAV